MELRVVVSLAPEAEALVERLVAALGRAAHAMAAPEISDDRQSGGSSSPLTQAPLPVPAAEQGPGDAPTVGSPSLPSAPPVKRGRHGHALAPWKTDAREALLRELLAKGANCPQIHAALVATDGPPVSPHVTVVNDWLRQLGLKPGRGLPPGPGVPRRQRDNGKFCRTEARRLVLEAMWGNEPTKAIHARLQAMEGPRWPLGNGTIYVWAKDLGLPPRAQLQRDAPLTDAAPGEAEPPAGEAGDEEAKEPPAPAVETVRRHCLRCQRPFDAPGRFVRLCAPCKKTSEMGGVAA